MVFDTHSLIGERGVGVKRCELGSVSDWYFSSSVRNGYRTLRRRTVRRNVPQSVETTAI